jgi:hypothetical protein
MTAGAELSCPVEVLEVNAMRLSEREQMLKDSLRVFMGRLGDQDGLDERKQ